MASISETNLVVTIVGGGLAGSEAAWQLASSGIRVRLMEMRPGKSSPAHTTGALAELVCSNSLGADLPASPAGILKEELRRMDSLIMRCAKLARVPAGGALAVDRELFSGFVTREVSAHPNIELLRQEAEEIPDGPAIIAAGPLMDGGIADAVEKIVGEDCLSFFDAAAPIVTLESIDMERAFFGGRYGQDDDYINCPLDAECYDIFIRELVSAERALTHSRNGSGGSGEKYFEGCLPVEVMAARGVDTLRFGPMRPVGLTDSRTGKESYAVVQLRRDNAPGTLYNMVGFQTNLKWPEQERVFRMIPALADAEFIRKGVMHENAFVCAPRVLDSFMRPLSGGRPARDDLFLAGQITGVEGYVESTASGLMAAFNLRALMVCRSMPEWPPETAIGSLRRYLSTAEPDSFRPMNVNLGIFPKLDVKKPRGGKKPTKSERSLLYAERSLAALEVFLGGRV
ncbi:MAG: methylenetetrahydrofolate--tRNA-(uracil(54)-C(5))-methyltransferase (FADH(2)-oxidizing) TrmFO [Synergistaceae bacterium]|nr:methylenetetrahydrofolate--tRNA-(uracil(54)-C(5))-methyltransferase (FADH(2)-oxidizing) TrmFO [Synergistaceae bacterium]